MLQFETYRTESFSDRIQHGYPEKNMSYGEQEVAKVKEEHYTPSWRAACDAWVTKCVEDRKGVHTPVYRLYNAYIRDNPEAYMDIGQFGKVLRSRFPFRKRRRGKQGQQVYVYQDVALKTSDNEEELSHLPSTKDQQPSREVGPSIVVGNSHGGRLLSSSHHNADDDTASRASPLKRSASRSPEFRKKSRTEEPIDLSDVLADKDDTSSDDKLANASLCRMALGRRWIDTNLIDMKGCNVSAEEVCEAYSRDHPHEPLTFTSLALLIRGKYPGRRKKVTDGRETKYIYQGLTLNKSSSSGIIVDEELLRKSSSPTSVLPHSNSETQTIYSKSTIEELVPEFSKTFITSQDTKVTPTLTSTSSKNSMHLNTGHILIPVAPTQSYHGLQFGVIRSPTVNLAIPSTSYVAVVKPRMPSKKTSNPRMDMQAHRLTGKNATTYDHLSPLNKSIDARQSLKRDPLAKGLDLTEQNRKNNSHSGEDDADNGDGMNVKEYLENELSEINHLNQVPGCKLSIKLPLETPPNISTYRGSSPPVPVSVDETVTGTEYNSRFRHVLAHGSGYQNLSDGTMPQSVSQEIPLVVQELSNEKFKPEPKRTWDYDMRMSLATDLGTPLLKNTSSKKSKNQGKKNREKNTMNRNMLPSVEAYDNHTMNTVEPRIMPSMPQITEPTLENRQYNARNVHKGNGGSPTSTSPPGAAMHRLAELIVTSKPYVGESLSQTSVCSAANVEQPREVTSPDNIVDPHVRKIMNSVGSVAKRITSLHNYAYNEFEILRDLEKAVIKENPAVMYDQHENCCPSLGLQELEVMEPEKTIEVLRHHQSCSGTGCSGECQALRAAYIHIVIFRHRCSVWDSFYKILAKHSRQCRNTSCGVEFCHFIKHELHMNRESILPIQLFKARASLEEEFKRCEEMGSHDGDLHCRHMPYASLPVFNPPMKNLQSKKDMIIHQQDRLSLTMSTAIPDTAIGNILIGHLSRVVALIRDLFKKSSDVT